MMDMWQEEDEEEEEEGGNETKKMAGKSWKNVNILFGNQDSEKWQKLTGWWNKQNTKNEML